jgi:small-conductance mechanosensitive channel
LRKFIKETKEFVRDSNNNAILRISTAEVNKYKSQREELLRQKNEINKLREEIENLRVIVNKLVNRTE